MTVENLKALESLNEFRLTDAEEQKAMEIFRFMENEAAEHRGSAPRCNNFGRRNHPGATDTTFITETPFPRPEKTSCFKSEISDFRHLHTFTIVQ